MSSASVARKALSLSRGLFGAPVKPAERDSKPREDSERQPPRG